MPPLRWLFLWSKFMAYNDIAQAIADAETDAQSLDEFINGGDEQIVITRLLKEYPTLANVIRQIYEKGGKFYPTLADANADIANIRTDVYVITGDNGAYYKATQDATSLTKSPYDPLEASKRYTNSTVQNKIERFFDYDFDSIYSFIIVDSEGNIIEAYDRNGNRVELDDEKFLFDFYSDNSERIVLVDKDLNIIFKNQNSSDLNFKNLQLNPYQPTPLKNKEAYIKYDTLKVQNVLTDDIYNKSVVDIVTNTAAVYAFYDQLVIKYPNYMSSSVLGTDALGNEIRQYVYTPRPLQSIESEGGDTTWGAELIKPPKIVITSGTHAGTEQEAILSAMILLKEVLERQNEIEAAMFLSQAQIVFIPVINPSGLNASTRHNHNDIDLNRDARQTADQIPSQLETQIAINLPTLHSDAICFFDLHNYDRNYVGAWLSTFTEQTLAELKPVALKLNAEIKHDHPFFADVPIRLQKNAARTIARDWQQFGGAKRGILIETASEDTLYPIFQKRQLAQYVIKTTVTHFLKLELGV